MRIDCHTHAFAEKIADKAVQQLINYYNIATNHGGKLSDLLKEASAAALDALILLVAATKPEQVKPANDWVLDLQHSYCSQPELKLKQEKSTIQQPRIIPFGTFHVADPNWEQEINRLRTAGIKGLKLHPEFQDIDLADPALHPFFETIGSDFVMMIHVGDPRISPDNKSTPRKIANLLSNFPKLKIIAAHLGGYLFWEEVLEVLAGKNVYLDTSSTLSYINPVLTRQIFQKHDSEMILFGSDYPLKSPTEELQLLEKLDWLTPAMKEQILGRNCARLLGIAKN